MALAAPFPCKFLYTTYNSDAEGEKGGSELWEFFRLVADKVNLPFFLSFFFCFTCEFNYYLIMGIKGNPCLGILSPMCAFHMGAHRIRHWPWMVGNFIQIFPSLFYLLSRKYKLFYFLKLIWENLNFKIDINYLIF